MNTEAVQSVAPSHRVRRAAHYMAAMGLWRPPSTQGVPGPLPSSSCNDCMMCSCSILGVYMYLVHTPDGIVLAT